MVDRYPDWTKQQLMLLWFWNSLQEAYEADDRSSLDVQIVRGGIATGFSEMGVLVWLPAGENETDPNVHSRRVNISAEIPELSRGAEAVAVFDQLHREGLIHATLGRGDSAVFYDLSNDGRISIGKFPEPGEKLAAALDAVRLSIEQDTSITETQRQSRLSAVTQTATLLNTIPELGQKAVGALQRVLSG